jgi:hypothetical protein
MMHALAVLSRDAGPAVTDVADRDPGPGEVRTGSRIAGMQS